jgi:glycosyltransferase involved in cell wall biosynthesis
MVSKHRILGIITDKITRDGKEVLDKDGNRMHGAIGWYRIVNPLKKMGATVEIGVGVQTTVENALKLKELGDIWYCKMADNEGIDHIYGAHKEFTGAKFILDLDDDIDNVDPGHPEYDGLKDRLEMRKRMVKMADHVVVASEEIKTNIKNINPNITVIPNAIDPEIWKVKKAERNDGKIRVGWMSSGSHFADMPIIEEIMLELGEEYPQLEFHIAGMLNETFKGKGWIHHKGTAGYLPFPQFYADLDIDIAIAPLKDTTFNRCKSNIKYLEASMLGIPTVASDVEPYKCIEHGKTGYLATTSGQFKKYLKWLIEDESKRKQMGKDAKKYVLDNWTIDKFLPKYEELFDKIMDKKDITVVTAITGGRDELKEQPQYPGVQYVAFTDEDLKDEQWEVRKACDKFREPVMNAKIHKILTHKYVDTPYILWMDGTLTLKQDPHELVKLMGDKDYAFFKHPGRDSIYDEAEACVRLNKGDVNEIGEQIKEYAKQGFPEKTRLCEMTAFIRKNNASANEMFEAWWVEICRYSNRDQISFPVVFENKEWTTIPGSVQKDFTGDSPNFPGNNYFQYKNHKN